MRPGQQVESSELEDRFKELGRRIAELDENKISSTECKQAISVLRFHIDDIKSFLLRKEDDTDLEDLKQEMVASLQSKEDAKDKHSYLLEKCSKALDLISSLQDRQGRVLSKIDDLSLSTSRIETIYRDVRSLEASVGALRMDLSSVASESKSLFMSMNCRMDQFQKDLSSFLSSHSDLSSQVQVIKDTHRRDRDLCIEKIGKIDSDMHEKHAAAIDHVTQSIEDLQVPKEGDYVNQSDIELLKHKLEHLGLDMKNCSLKSSNMDLMFQRQQKLIENLQLSLKQYELSK